MHFHCLARCLECKDFIQFSTPIPNVLSLASWCDNCGAFGLIGYTGNEFKNPGHPCQECFLQHVDTFIDAQTSPPSDA